MDFINLFSAALTPLIALIAIYIAWQQHKTKKDTFRLALYDRRLKVYERLKNILIIATSKGDVPLDAVDQYQIDTAEAVFLFDSDVSQYVDTVRKHAIDLRAASDRLYEQNLPVGDERKQVVQQKSELVKWFMEQSKEATEIFQKYLRFSE